MSYREHAETADWVEPELDQETHDVLRALAFLDEEELDDQAARILRRHCREAAKDPTVRKLVRIIAAERETTHREVDEAIARAREEQARPELLVFARMEITGTDMHLGRRYRCPCSWEGWTAWGNARRHAETCPQARGDSS